MEDDGRRRGRERLSDWFPSSQSGLQFNFISPCSCISPSGTHLDVPDRLSSSDPVPVLATRGNRAHTLLGRREALPVSDRREPARPKVLPCLVVPIILPLVAY